MLDVKTLAVMCWVSVLSISSVAINCFIKNAYIQKFYCNISPDLALDHMIGQSHVKLTF